LSSSDPEMPYAQRPQALRNTVEDLTEEVEVLRNELVRKDAIIEGLLATLAKSAITTTSSRAPAASAAPLTKLCQISKEACDAVAPMLAVRVPMRDHALLIPRGGRGE
jgi:hypothetical protein